MKNLKLYSLEKNIGDNYVLTYKNKGDCEKTSVEITKENYALIAKKLEEDFMEKNSDACCSVSPFATGAFPFSFATIIGIMYMEQGVQSSDFYTLSAVAFPGACLAASLCGIGLGLSKYHDKHKSERYLNTIENDAYNKGWTDSIINDVPAVKTLVK